MQQPLDKSGNDEAKRLGICDEYIYSDIICSLSVAIFQILVSNQWAKETRTTLVI
jgi:hypothetical protein